MKLVLTNKLITCAGNCAYLQEGDYGILIDNDRIARIDCIDLFKEEINDNTIEKINLNDKFVLPGLIDAHLHLSFSSSSQPVTELLNDSSEEILLRMVSAAQAELKSGVTTVRDSGSKGMSILALKSFINRGIIEGPDIITAGMPITTTGGHCNFCGLECDSLEEVRKAVRMLCKSGVDYIKVMVSGGNMTPGSDSTITQYRYDILKEIVNEAHQHGKKVSGHVHTVDGIHDAIMAGFDTLEHCSFKSSTGEEDYRSDLVDLMVNNNISVCPAFSKSYVVSAEEGAPQPDKIAIWDTFKQSRFNTTKKMYNAGVRIIAGTDAGCKNTKFNEFWKVVELLHTEIGMTTEEALLSATYSSADALGFIENTGSVEVGKQADLIAVSENPLEDLSALSNISFVMKKGKRVGI